MLGHDGVDRILAELRSNGAEDVSHLVEESLTAHIDGARLDDDVTFVVVEFTGKDDQVNPYKHEPESPGEPTPSPPALRRTA